MCLKSNHHETSKKGRGLREGGRDSGERRRVPGAEGSNKFLCLLFMILNGRPETTPASLSAPRIIFTVNKLYLWSKGGSGDQGVIMYSTPETEPGDSDLSVIVLHMGPGTYVWISIRWND